MSFLNFIAKNKTAVILSISCLLIFLGGFKTGYMVKKCPTIKAGITVIDTVIIHDTVRTVTTDVTEKIKPVITYVKVRDTITNTVIAVAQIDTERCYEFKDTIQGAYLSAEICSKFFPVKKPLDLTGSFTFVPAPDTQFVRIDTVMYNKPFFKEPKNYIIAGLVGIIGTGIYLSFR
jgi:hypothetical protein